MRSNEDISHELKTETNVIILAGGNSSRMDYPKAWLPFDNEQTILEHIISQYQMIGSNKIVIVLNKSFIGGFTELIGQLGQNVFIVRNENPQKGRIYSLKLGIKHLNKTGHTFIHNVDNPYANYLTLNALLKQHFNDYARPVFNNHGGHPILVSDVILETILQTDDNVILRDLLNKYSVNNVHVLDADILCNINTPDDFINHFGKQISELVNPVNENLQ